MTSLGNIEATPLACISIASFTTGDVLYLTGTARNVYGAEAQSIMPFQDRLTEIHVTGYTFVRAALPLRAVPDYKIEASPYSPPIKLLAEELPKGSQLFMNASSGLPKALLRKVEVHSADLATFTWEIEDTGDDAEPELVVQPGQAVILDFKTLLGERRYAHMMPGKPAAVNDDYVRTWTVSRFSPRSGTKKAMFALTMREISGGTVTGALFGIVRKLQQVKPHILDDARDLDLKVGVVGISGDFVLPLVPARDSTVSATPPKLVWIAGGIGITPFLAMLRTITSPDFDQPTPEVTLVVSTREVDVMAALVSQALNGKQLPSTVSVHIFSTLPILRPDAPPLSSSTELDAAPSSHKSVSTKEHGSQVPASLDPPSSASSQVTHASGLFFTQHSGRVHLDAVLNPSSLSGLSGGSIAGSEGTQFYACGPLAFETAINDSLGGLGVSSTSIHRETFAY